ncbi:MAG: hypothetical protein V3V14_10960 [Saprospiraceae bacterium]
MNYYNQIEAYKEGRLNLEMQEAFELAMKNDHHLSNLVGEYHTGKKIAEGLLELDVMETINSLKDDQNVQKSSEVRQNHIAKMEDVPKKENSMLIFLFKILVGTCVLGFLVIASLKLMNNTTNQKQQKERVWATYVKPVNPNATKSGSVKSMNAFEKGKYYFALNDFNQSEKWIKSFLKNTSNVDSLSMGYFWLGASHIEQWEVEEAIQAWKKSNEKESKENLKILQSN